MIHQITSYLTILGMAGGLLMWVQSSFVSAMDFMEQQYFTVREEINYLQDKKLRLEDEESTLVFEDKRKLERLENKLKFIQQQMKK